MIQDLLGTLRGNDLLSLLFSFSLLGDFQVFRGLGLLIGSLLFEVSDLGHYFFIRLEERHGTLIVLCLHAEKSEAIDMVLQNEVLGIHLGDWRNFLIGLSLANQLLEDPVFLVSLEEFSD